MIFAVGEPLAVAEQPENKSLRVGVLVTVTGVVGTPLVSSSHFALGPVEDSTYGTMTPGTDADSHRAGRRRLFR